MLTRRFILAAAAATAAAHAIPAAIAAAPVAAPAPLLPAWVVGTDGEFDFQLIRANTLEEAIAERIRDETGLDGCECEVPASRDCDFCAKGFDAYRVPTFDTIERPTPADWLRADMGHHCSRCGYETFSQEDGRPVGDEAVCHDCMTLEDWDIVDPAKAAELRAEMADD